MTTESAAAAAGTGAAMAAGAISGLPNPIASALYALGAAVIGWLVTWILNALKKKLGL